MIEPNVPKPSASFVPIADDNRDVTAVINNEPKGDGFGRGKERNCTREVKRFATRITKLFAPEIASDPRGFKKNVTTILKRN